MSDDGGKQVAVAGAAADATAPVQAYAGKIGGGTLADQSGGGGEGGAAHQAAQRGVAGGGAPLPFKEIIQRAFGRHDVGGIQAHVGGDAADASGAIGASAYATGNHVAFAGQPDLHTTAHEAAHVVQQRAGVQLKGGFGSAGDAHESHADAVADRVVSGGSAEGLLDQYAGSGGGGGQAVQRIGTQDAQMQALIADLERFPALYFTPPATGAMNLGPVTNWIGAFTDLVAQLKSMPADPNLQMAADAFVGQHAGELQRAAAAIRAAAIAQINSSSVTANAPTTLALPTSADTRAMQAAAGVAHTLGGDARIASAAPRASLVGAADTATDAALAIIQGMAVNNDRERWGQGATHTSTPDPAKKHTANVVDDVFKTSGFGPNGVTGDGGGKSVADWCGMFVVSGYVAGATLAPQLRAAWWHTLNLRDFFHYRQDVKPDRVPAAIWVEGRWQSVHDYHAARGSVRMWTDRNTIKAAFASGGSPDIRPGDTVLIDHSGTNTVDAQHITMVESWDPVKRILVTIEGNTHGIQPDATDSTRADRVDADHLKQQPQSASDPTTAGLHQIDMGEYVPYPAKFNVASAKAQLHDENDVATVVKDGGKPKLVAKDTVVTIVGEQKHSNTVFLHLSPADGGGWLARDNLKRVPAPAPPKGSSTPNHAATVWAVGRPSFVDFETHDYSVKLPPAALLTTSPDDIKAMAKKGDTDAKSVAWPAVK
ncbi:MAG TPA: DUF4157 domain-containing protein [Kofleriaceae bacterium]|jgi:hypothetical protein